MTFSVRMAGSDRAEVLLYDVIGEDFFGGISAVRFVNELKKIGNVSVINLRVSSEGGNPFQAVAMYNALVRNPARIEVDIDSMALSAASIPIMAGDVIRMADNAMLMIHSPWTPVGGNASELRSMADLLDQVEDNIISVYKKRVKKTEAQLREMVSDETWMRASEAVAEGFVDEITEELPIAAHFDASRFKNVPKYALERFNGVVTPRTDMFRTKLRDIAKRAAAIGLT